MVAHSKSAGIIRNMHRPLVRMLALCWKVNTYIGVNTITCLISDFRHDLLDTVDIQEKLGILLCLRLTT